MYDEYAVQQDRDEAKRDVQVSAELNRCDEEFERVLKIVAVLERRLESVLREDTPPDTPGPSVLRDKLVPLASRIQDHSDRLTSLSSRLRGIESRLEV